MTSPIKWGQRPDITNAVDWDAKQTKCRPHNRCMYISNQTTLMREPWRFIKIYDIDEVFGRRCGREFHENFEVPTLYYKNICYLFLEILCICYVTLHSVGLLVMHVSPFI